MPLNFIDTYASLLAAIFGGLGVKIIEKVMSKRNEVFNEAVKIREELRAELSTLKEELSELKAEVDVWRGKYYELIEERVKFVAENELLRAELSALKMTLNSSTDEDTDIKC